MGLPSARGEFAKMAVFNPFDFFLEPQAEKFPFAYDRALDHELAPFQRKCWLTPHFTKYETRKESKSAKNPRILFRAFFLFILS